MKIPDRLENLLRTDQRLYGAVCKTLADFEIWIAENRMPFFPGFTDHGTTHLERVMRGVHDLIEEDAWEHLTPRDAACIALAVLLHDCAMHLSEDGFVWLAGGNTWRPTGLFIDKFRDERWPDLWHAFVREATRWDDRRQLAIFGRVIAIRATDLKPQASWDDDQRLFVGEFLRRHHARLAHEIALLGVPGTGDARVCLTELPEPWLGDLAGFIARSHNLSLRDAVAKLETNGRKAWRKVHVPYVMALLRVADYLEIQAPRAPRDVLKIRSLRSPVSRIEWRKHQAVHDICPHESDPCAIFVDAEPPDVETFLALQRLLADLQREIDDCSNVLCEVYGSDPELRNLGLSVRRVYSSIDDLEALAKRVSYVPVHARFQTSSGEVLKLLVGPLYDNDPSYGARELIQNAIDACRELEDWRAQHPDIDVELREQRADVVVLVEERADGSALFTISDRGIGMTAATIKDYFLIAGATFRHSDAWIQRHLDLQGRPRVARSGRFGVGALAAFLIGPEMEVETRSVDSAIGCRLTCRLDSPQIEIVKHRCPVGTTIRIEMPRPVRSDSRRAIERFSREGVERFFVDDDRNGDVWDWYSAPWPSLARGVVRASQRGPSSIATGEISWLDTHAPLPAPGEALDIAWDAITHPDYDAIHWSPVREGLWCNGLQIQSPNRLPGAAGPNLRFREGSDYEVCLRYPALSLWDPRGHLPLSLKRDQLAAPLPFDDQLEAPLCRDILAHVLVRLERDRVRCLEQLATSLAGFMLSATFQRDRPLPLDHLCLITTLSVNSHWLGVRAGEALLIEPALIAASAPSSIVFVPGRVNPDELIEPFAREFHDDLVVFQSEVASGAIMLGSRRSTAALWEAYACGDPMADDELAAARLMFAGLDREKCIAREVLVAVPVRKDFVERVGPYRYAASGEKGNRLPKFVQSTAGRAVAPRLAAWKLAAWDEKPQPGRLAKHWLELIGPRGVPLDPARRRDELRDVYRELAREIRRWEILTERES